MNMKKFILKNKNTITIINATLIIIAFTVKFTVADNRPLFQTEHFALDNADLFYWALLAASIIGIAPIAIQAYESLKVRVVSIDVLVTVAVIGAVIIHNVEESAIVTFLFLFGSYLEQRTLHKTRSAIKELTALAPETALKKTADGSFEEVGIEEIEENDVVLVRTGASIPVDGTVLTGEGYVNEASITGESAPVTKLQHATVFAGTMLENGTLQVRADRVGEDTTFGKIIELVEESQDAKSQTERFIDRFAKYYTPAVLVLAVAIWLVTQNVELAITALVLGCPGALVIGVPVSNVSGIGNGARNGVLLKGSEIIQSLSKVDTIAFDKTGTLTVGNPKVAEWKTYSRNEKALDYLASVERESDHPLAKAVLEHINDANFYPVTDTEVVKGKGIIANVNGERIAVGNVALMEHEHVTVSEQQQKDIEQFAANGNSLVLTAIDNELTSLLGIRDQIRPEVKEQITAMKRLGVKNFIVLSGDNEKAVEVVANELGFTEAHGNMLPEEKATFIKERQAKGEIVAFIGDGINDSPSLALADIGIAMGSGTDVAIETSDVVLVNSSFAHFTHALGLTKAMTRNMWQNITIALGVVLILLSGLLFSDWMTMSIGMLAHEVSIFVVILNGMRLLRYRSRKTKLPHDEKVKNTSQLDAHQLH